MKIRFSLVVALCVAYLPLVADPLPTVLAGSWKITRMLPTKNTPCWGADHARPLLGSTLEYHSDTMRWRGGEVPLQGVVTRSVTAEEFRKENSTLGVPPEFSELGIRSPRVTEVDMQHEDADITGSTTEVPGDAVLIVTPNKIVVSACGVYFEAIKTTNMTRTPAHR